MSAEALRARDELNGIAMLLHNQRSRLQPAQVEQLLERAMEDCKPFLPAELHTIIDDILDDSAQVRAGKQCGRQDGNGLGAFRPVLARGRKEQEALRVVSAKGAPR